MISRRAIIGAGAALLASPARAAFNTNGPDQRMVDFNLRPSVRGTEASTLAGKVQVSPSSLTGAVHLIFDGQSTNSCSVDTNYTGSTANIYNLSIAHRGAVFNAADPLLSCDITQGHHGLYLARSLIDGGYASKVLITLVCFGGSYAADHRPGGGLVGGAFAGTSPGDCAYRIGLAARSIYNAGLWNLRTIIDWQQGEWDSDSVPTTQANYTAALAGVIAEYKRVGLLRQGNVMLINQCTRITNAIADRNQIRAGQVANVDGNLVRLGADADTLGASYRYDGTHFNATGAAAQAALKAPSIRNYLLHG